MNEIELNLKTLNNYLIEQKKYEIQMFFKEKSFIVDKSVLGTLEPSINVSENLIINEIKLDYNPYSLCCLPKNRILVSDYINNQLLVYDENFKLYKTIKKIDNMLLFPLGISTDGVDKIYVCDHKNNRIILVDLKFKLKSSFGAKGSGNSELFNPYDVFYFNSNVLICDFGNKRIQKLTEDLVFVSSLKLVYEPHQVRAANNRLFVRAYNEKLIDIYDSEKFDHVKRIDSHNGIICESNSNIFEFNTEYSKINCYDSNGILMKYFDLKLENTHFFNLFGFVYFKEKNIFVASAEEKLLTISR